LDIYFVLKFATKSLENEVKLQLCNYF